MPFFKSYRKATEKLPKSYRKATNVICLLLLYCIWLNWSGINAFAKPLCTPPTQLSITNPTVNSVSLSWNAVLGVSHYRVQSRLLPNGGWMNSGGVIVNNNQATINNLAPNQQYEARVGSRCGMGSVFVYSDVLSFSTLNCDGPSNLSVDASNPTTATVSWTPLPGVTLHVVQYRSLPNGNWQTAGGVVNGNSQTINGLVAGQSYEVRVGSKCTNGNTFIYGNPIGFVAGMSCNTPEGLVVSEINHTTATLSWQTVSSSSGYTVDYRVQGAQTWTSVNVGTNNYALTGLTPNTTYETRVRTRCGTLLSPWTTTTNFTTLSCPIPTGLTTTNVSYTSATLNWGAVSGTIGYTVNYRVQGSQTWVSAAAETNNLPLTGLTSGATYEFQVKTDCGSGVNSDFSGIEHFTTECPIPRNYRFVQVTPDGVRIAWGDTLDPFAFVANIIVRYRIVGNSAWTTIVTSETEYQLTNLTQGLRYEVQIATQCAVLASSFMGSFEFTPMEAQADPTEIMVENLTDQVANDYVKVTDINNISNPCHSQITAWYYPKNVPTDPSRYVEKKSYFVYGFKPGDKVLLIQMQEDLVQNLVDRNTENPECDINQMYGRLNNDITNNVGNYEILTVETVAINGNYQTLTFTSELVRQYDWVKGRVQIVRILTPLTGSNTLTINTKAIESLGFSDIKQLLPLRALKWEGGIGGVIAIDAETLKVFTNISAYGAGFRSSKLHAYFLAL